MSLRTFHLQATVITTKAGAVRGPVGEVLGITAKVEPTGDGVTVEVAAIVAVDPREINRRLLGALRRVDPGARLRSAWTAGGVTERFRDYVFVKEGRR
jgi:hypothetical protein